MTDFRALCAELADELQGYKVAHPMHCRALLNRARAETKRHAIRYAQARWPGAVVEAA